MKKILLAALAAAMLSGCVLLEDDFWDDYDSTYDSPSGDDDCDC
ncbi:MAG: lipoprotein [Hyphomonadaceae bacterium]